MNIARVRSYPLVCMTSFWSVSLVYFPCVFFPHLRQTFHLERQKKRAPSQLQKPAEKADSSCVFLLQLFEAPVLGEVRRHSRFRFPPLAPREARPPSGGIHICIRATGIRVSSRATVFEDSRLGARVEITGPEHWHAIAPPACFFICLMLG